MLRFHRTRPEPRTRKQSPLQAKFQLVTLEDRSVPAVSFDGVALDTAPSGFIPPDTMGAIGPNHFVQSINGAFAIYSRTGTQISLVNPNTFFDYDGAGPGPLNGTFDPRILFNQSTGRWFATTMERGATSGRNNNIVLAVSQTNDPTGTWDRYVIPVGVPDNGATNYFTDYSTLGVDSNGVYFGMTIFPSSGGSFARIAATPLAPLISGTPSLGAVTVFGSPASPISDMYSSPQPALNFDAISSSSPAFLVSSSTTVFQNVNYRTITWSAGVPTLSATSVAATPRVYNNPVNAPASGSATPINVGDDRLQMAVIRNGHLWTARNVGLNSAGGSASPTRTGVEWLDMTVSGTTLTHNQGGFIYDSAASNANSYFYPSVAVTGQGHVRIGFSGVNATSFVGAYRSSRFSSDPANTISAPVQFQAGLGSYQRLDTFGRNRWGDYSYTSVDPTDDMTVWTIQEYAGTSNFWRTRIASFDAISPTLNNPFASGNQGQTGVVVNLTGANFFEPGVSFPNHLNVSFSGTGITVTNVTYNSPTSVSVTIDISAGATLGSRNITLTNPDGQQYTAINAFTVNAATPFTVSSINRSSANPTAANTVSWLLTVTRTATGVSPGAFTLVSAGLGGTPVITSVTPVGALPASTWTIVASTGTGTGTLGLNLTSGSGITDENGVPLTGTPFIGEVYTIDRTNPGDPVFSSTPSNPSNVTGPTFVWNSVTDSGGAGLAGYQTKLDGGAWSATQVGTTKALVGLSDGSHTFMVQAIDNVGNVSSTPASFTWTVDTVAPSTTSFVRQTPAGTPTNADTLVFRVTFNEAVTGVDAADFAASGTTAGIAVSTVSSTQYDVTLSGGDLSGLNGVVGLNFAGTVTIQDLATNALPGTEPPTDETYLVDNLQAALTALKPIVTGGAVVNVNLMALPPGSMLPWQIIGFQAEFSENVTGVTLATLTGLSATSLTIVNGTTAQFSVATITIGTFTVGISGTGIADLAGNTGLTGALSNTLSTKYGDVNGSGSVTNADLNAIRNSYLNGLPYNPFLDLNGDGIVDREDYNLARSRIGT